MTTARPERRIPPEPKSMAEPPQAVFLSYASQDAQAARRICDALRSTGIEVWFDQSELRGGDAWDQMIRQQIRECALFVPVISATTAARHEGYFRLEWSLAEQRSHMIARNKAFIVPVCIDATPDAGADVPESFLRVHWTRLPGGETPPAFCEHVATLLGAAGTAGVGRAAGDSPLAGGLPIAARRSPALPVWGWIALACVAAGTMVWQPWRSARNAAPVPAAAAGRTAAASSASLPGTTAPAPGAVPEKSIAVLPFVDLSEKKDQEYFADGLAEELLSLLAQVPDLRVPARSSSFYFKGKNEKLATIADELAVAYVLEGSVRKANDRIRVGVQLIRADTGYHMWSATYDRNLRDVFMVQDEIAAAVVDALKLRLGAPAVGLAERRTSNPQAHDQYLMGNYYFNLGTDQGYQHAVAAFRQAIDLDANFALPYSGLAMAEYLLASDYSDHVPPEVVAQAVEHADRAVALAPDLATAYSTRAFLREQAMWDWAGARSDLNQALALDANDATVQRRLGFFLSSQGDVEGALAAERRAVEVDPMDANSVEALASQLAASGRPSDALREYVRTRTLNPVFTDIDASIGTSYLLAADPARAKRECQRSSAPAAQACLAVAEHALGNAQRSKDLLDALIASHGKRAQVAIAAAFAQTGETERAFEWLDRAFRAHRRELAQIKSQPAWASLRGDPRYSQLLRRMNLPV